MTSAPQTLCLLDPAFAIYRLDPRADLPPWLPRGQLTSVTRTTSELSIVCPQQAVAEGVRCEPGWRALEVQGPLEFSLVGVVASLTQPLAEAGVSVFVLSTFDTDYVLVREADLPKAVAALRASGHRVLDGQPGFTSTGQSG